MQKTKLENPYLEIFETEALHTFNFSQLTTEKNVFQRRDELVGEYSWAVPNQDAIDIIASCTPIIEIGAGTGFWAYLIEQAGGVCYAYDDFSWKNCTNARVHFKKIWTNVREGSFEKIKDHPDSTLFLCWPPYRDPLALNCLNTYEGNTLLYVGERDGCTGCGEFQALIDKEWEEINSIQIPQYFGIHDYLMVLKRK